MHDDYAAGAVAMRVSIFFGGTTVRGPTRVTDTVSAVERLLSQSLFEVAQFSCGATNFELMILVDNGDARRIIATVFKFAQAVDYQRHHLFVSHVSDYSTHISEQ